MFAWTSHGTELKRFFRQPITRAAIAVMLLIPLLYGAMYVWAFWDPTTHMNELPVALVNTDVAKTDDDGGWVKHTEYHWARIVAGKRLDYWPSRSKFMYDGKVQRGDVMKFIKEHK